MMLTNEDNQIKQIVNKDISVASSSQTISPLSRKHSSLMTINEIPRWYLTNASIVYGYRPIVPSFKRCIVSLVHLHNETGNIWTHLIGASLFVNLFIYDQFYPPVANMTRVDMAFLDLYLVGVILCLVFSALFHLLACYSKPVFNVFAKLDYTGISILIATSFVPWIYYSFYNSFTYQVLYMTVSILFGTVCIIISMFDHFAEPRYRRLRGLLFLGYGLSGVLPVIHWVARELAYGERPFLTLDHRPTLLLVTMAVAYVCGALLYLFKLPEGKFIGRFDLWFNSHQLFHLMVIAGSLFYYHGLVLLIELRVNDPKHFYN